MQVQWQKLFVKTTVWLTAEIVLNLLGLDNLADYSEFLQQSAELSALSRITPQQVIELEYPMLPASLASHCLG